VPFAAMNIVYALFLNGIANFYRYLFGVSDLRRVHIPYCPLIEVHHKTWPPYPIRDPGLVFEMIR
jgi:hypothetical protein